LRIALAQVNIPGYSPDLAASDFHLFSMLKEFLGARRFKGDEEVKDDVKKWLNALAAAAAVYNEDIQKLVTGYDKCQNVGGGCVKKKNNLRSVIMYLDFIFLYSQTIFTFWTTFVMLPHRCNLNAG
jgi:hypothetical protein